MPGTDHRGPLGEGPMTGRGSGYCMLPVHEDMDFASGRGRGRRQEREQIQASGEACRAQRGVGTFEDGRSFRHPGGLRSPGNGRWGKGRQHRRFRGRRLQNGWILGIESASGVLDAQVEEKTEGED